jgi:hypothetical protein
MAKATAITPEDLVKRVESAQGNIAIATFLELRSAYNRGRITPGVFDWIATKLENDHRIGVTADSSEPSQEQEAYLFKLDAPVGGLLAAVSHPSEAGLRRLREVATPARKAAEADASIATVKAALEDATVALQEYLGENGST